MKTKETHKDTLIINTHRGQAASTRWLAADENIQALELNNIEYRVLNESQGHIRVGNYDVWLTTGSWWNRETGKRGYDFREVIRDL